MNFKGVIGALIVASFVSGFTLGHVMVPSTSIIATSQTMPTDTRMQLEQLGAVKAKPVSKEVSLPEVKVPATNVSKSNKELAIVLDRISKMVNDESEAWEKASKNHLRAQCLRAIIDIKAKMDIYFGSISDLGNAREAPVCSFEAISELDGDTEEFLNNYKSE